MASSRPPQGDLQSQAMSPGRDWLSQILVERLVTARRRPRRTQPQHHYVHATKTARLAQPPNCRSRGVGFPGAPVQSVSGPKAPRSPATAWPNRPRTRRRGQGSTIEACATALTPTAVTTVTRRACPAGTQSCRGAGTAGAAPPTWSARSASGSGRRPTRDRQRHRGDDRAPVEVDPRRHRARRPRRQRHRPGTPRRRGNRIGDTGGRQFVKQSVDCYRLLYDWSMSTASIAAAIDRTRSRRARRPRPQRPGAPLPTFG